MKRSKGKKMNRKSTLGTQAALGTLLCGLSAGPALAADAAATDDGTETVVVTGVRASLQSAQERKQNSLEIVDSVVADDIGKLPDNNTTEALQRVSGVQVQRNYGEGQQVQVRGLSQVQTTLNGRDVFTAQGTRGLNFQDVPAELLAGIDVYKSPSASQLEGGLGGLVDLRTRKPFDFKGLTVAGSAMGNYGDLSGKTSPQASVLVSDRWGTAGGGEFGALLSASYQDRKFRADLSSVGTPTARTDLIAGQTVVAPSETYDVPIIADRRRIGVDGTLQWRPSQGIELYLQGNLSDLRGDQNQYGADLPLSGATPLPGAAVTLFPGTSDVSQATYQNVAMTVLGFIYDVREKNRQVALGGSADLDRWHLSADLSYTDSTGSATYSDMNINATVPQFTQNLASSVPGADAHGYNLLDPANYTATIFMFFQNLFEAKETAAKFDAKLDMGDGFARSFDVGLRYAARGADSGGIQDYEGINNWAGTPVSQLPAGLVIANPASDYFNKVDASTPLLRDFLVADPEAIRRSPAAFRKLLGLPGDLPGIAPLTYYHVAEKTTALYGMLDFGQPGSRVDGNVGVRFVHTGEDVTGNQTLDAGATILPINLTSSYNDVLPSLNVRFHLNDTMQVRFAASKAVTRPDFSYLAPTLNLNPVFHSGSAGNPDLRPLKADQLDATFEYYFSKSGSTYASAFYKKVDGFITQTSDVETINGAQWTITRPTNGEGGKVKGLEVGYQQFFDFLPGAFSGLGAQANYTYVDSSTPTSIAGQETPLPLLSKNSYNLVGMYEHAGISARVAYNWRSQYFESVFVGGPGVGVNPNYRKGFGWMDASVSYDITPHFTLALEGSNLLRAKRESFYGQETRRHETEINDRQIMFGFRAKL